VNRQANHDLTLERPLTEPVRLAVVGLGFMGRRYAALAADLAGARLTAVCDVNSAAATDVAGQTCAAAFVDHRELLDADIADAVILALPESGQVMPAVHAAAAGRHLLVEKPVASTRADADALEAGLAGTPGTHASAHLLRADPRYHAAIAAIRSADFGSVVHISASRRSRLATAQRVAGRTSLLYYLGVHDLDAMAWFAGSPIRTVHALGRRTAGWDMDVDATILVLLECANGTIGQLELTWAVADSHPLGLEAATTVVGSGGTVTIGGGDEVYVADAAGRNALDTVHWPVLGSRVVGTLRYQVEQWVAAIQGQGPVAATIEDGLAASRVAFAIEDSLRTGQPATVRA
jgi:predicted dehydrogenase